MSTLPTPIVNIDKNCKDHSPAIAVVLKIKQVIIPQHSTYKFARIYISAHTHALANLHIHVHLQIHTYRHTYTYSHTHVHGASHIHTQTHTHTSHTYANTHTCNNNNRKEDVFKKTKQFILLMAFRYGRSFNSSFLIRK